MKLQPLLLILLVLCVGCSQGSLPGAAPAAATPEQAYSQAKKAYASDPTTKAELVAATVAYAHDVMTVPGKSNVKYPHALRLYEEALKLDPANEEAKQNRDMILRIYDQLGKKPPKN